MLITSLLILFYVLFAASAFICYKYGGKIV